MGSMRKSRLSKYNQGRLVEHFVAGTTARTEARLCGVNRKTSMLYFSRLPEIIAYELEAETANMFDGEIEVVESCFGGKPKGKRGRGAAGKIPVFGLLKGVERFIPRSSRTLHRQRYSQLSSAR